MNQKYILIITAVAVLIIAFWLVLSFGFQEKTCSSDADCVIKEGQCGPACFHMDEEPEIDPRVDCEYRPWFKQEKCECINGKCTKILCEDLGLDYAECGQ